MKKISIGFFGTPELSKRVLEDLYNNENFEIKFVVSGQDKPIGRKLILTANPTKTFAISQNIPVFTPAKIRGNKEFLTEIKNIPVDFFVVVAYGKILPNEILEMPKIMCVNVHGSILPKYRGASPIQSSLIAGDQVTGVTIMKMSEGMDEGDILDILEINIDKYDTTEILFDKFADVSGDFLAQTLQKVYNGQLEPKPQNNSLATYCKKITKEDGLIDFKEIAQNIFYKWKGFTPWPGIFTYFQGKKLIITKCDYVENGENPKIVIPNLFRNLNENLDAEINSVLQNNETINIISPVDCHDFSNEKSRNDDNLKKSINNIGKVTKTTTGYGIICGNSSILELIEVKLEGKGSQNIKDFINGHQNFEGYIFNTGVEN